MEFLDFEARVLVASSAFMSNGNVVLLLFKVLTFLEYSLITQPTTHRP